MILCVSELTGQALGCNLFDLGPETEDLEVCLSYQIPDFPAAQVGCLVYTLEQTGCQVGGQDYFAVSGEPPALRLMGHREFVDRGGILFVYSGFSGRIGAPGSGSWKVKTAIGLRASILAAKSATLTAFCFRHSCLLGTAWAVYNSQFLWKPKGPPTGLGSPVCF